MFNPFNSKKSLASEPVIHSKHSVMAEQQNVEYAKVLFQINQDRTIAHTSVKSALLEEPVGVINKENFNLDDLKAGVQPTVTLTKSVTKNEKNKTYHLSNSELKS